MKKEGILYLSPSSLNLYLTCPLLYKNKSINIQNDSILKFGSWIHKTIELYFESEKQKDIFKISKSIFTQYDIDLDSFLDGQKILQKFIERSYLNFKTLSFEEEFKDILSNGIALKGRIDLIIERDEETIEVIDFKSGWKFYSVVMLNKNMQLKIYKNLICNDKRFKKYKNIILTIDPIRFEPISIVQDDVDNKTFLDWIEEIYLKISNEKEYQPNFPNNLCKNCFITDQCVEYKSLLNNDYKIKKGVEEKLSHYLSLQKIKKVIENDVDFYKKFFEGYIDKNSKTNEIKIGKFCLTLKNKKLYCMHV